MSATQERSRPSIWAVGVRQVVYMALGAALYGGLSYLTNFLQLPSVGNVSIRPAIVIPLFFGAVFGPIVGLITGGLGNFLGDLISGYGVYLNWDIGNGLIGFFAGLASLSLFNTSCCLQCSSWTQGDGRRGWRTRRIAGQGQALPLLGTQAASYRVGATLAVALEVVRDRSQGRGKPCPYHTTSALLNYLRDPACLSTFLTSSAIRLFTD